VHRVRWGVYMTNIIESIGRLRASLTVPGSSHALLIDMGNSIRHSAIGDQKRLSVSTPEGQYLALGVGSVQPDERHVMFLDLDGYEKDECESIAKELISNLGVSDCYIVQSSKIEGRPTNHHLVCLDLVSFKLARKVAQAYGHEAWAKFRGMNEDYVIRIGPKVAIKDGRMMPVEGTMPKLVSIVKSPFNYNEKSNGLRKVFRNVWGYPIEKDELFNDDMAFRMHIYRLRYIKGKSGKIVDFKRKVVMN
jgi:hypothetical protein